jgi:hypothetical protein
MEKQDWNAAATKVSTSLFFSLPASLPAILAASFAILIVGLQAGWLYGALFGAVVGAAFIAFLERRIDVDHAGLTLVPLLPLRRSQRFSFAELGPFEVKHTTRGYYEALRAAIIAPGPRYRLGGIFLRDVLSLTAIYSLGATKPRLKVNELQDLVAAYRDAD